MEVEELRKEKQRKISVEIISLLSRELGKLYLVQIAYIGLFFLLFNQVFSYILNALLKRYGFSYITQEVMLQFIKSPLVIGTFFIEGLFGCIFIQYIILYSYEYIRKAYINEDFSMIELFLITGKKYISLIKVKCGSFFILLNGMIIFFNLPAIYFVLHFFEVPKVMFRLFLEMHYVKPAVWGLIISVILYGLIRFFALQIYSFEQKSVKDARKFSRLILKQHWHKIVALWTANNAIIVGITIILYVTLTFFTIVVICLFVQVDLKIAVFCTVKERIYHLILAITVLLGTNLHVTGNVVLFCHCSPEQKQHEEEIPSGALGLRKRVMGIGLIVILLFDIFLANDTIKNGGIAKLDHVGELTLTSHRGDSQKAPENTIPAIEFALESTTDYIEFDVQETKDGVIVLMHDGTTFRTTGEDKRISELTYEEVCKLDAGKWFGKDFVSTRIPTFEEVLALCKGKKKLNIEIKTNEATPLLEKKTVELIEKYEFERQCVITSAHKESLTKVKEMNPEILTGYILISAYGRYYLDEEIDFLSMRSSYVNERVIRLAHKFGKEVHVWTVNSTNEAIRLSQLGVDNIITDKPDYIRERLYENKENPILIKLLKLFL